MINGPSHEQNWLFSFIWSSSLELCERLQMFPSGYAATINSFLSSENYNLYALVYVQLVSQWHKTGPFGRYLMILAS